MITTDQQLALSPLYGLLTASKNAAGEIAVSSKNINEFRSKNKPKKDEETPENEKKEESPIKETKIKRIIQYVEKPVNYMLSATSFSLLLLATFLLLWQLVGKIRSYMDNPVQVTSTYTYPDQLSFPNIILCNTKPWRRSFVSKTSMVNLFNYSFDPTGSNLNATDLKEIITMVNNETNMTEFYFEALKKRQHFILGCELPNKTECNMSLISLKLTDFGICFSLDQISTLNISHAGSENGLQLMLNIESYDSLPDRTKTAGARLILYDKTETPSVTHLGVDMPPGMLTSVALSYSNIQRLKKDEKGKCDPNAKLYLFKNYSFSACKIEKLFLDTVIVCKCKPYNYPDETNYGKNVQSCNAEQEIFCVNEKMRKYKNRGVDLCYETCNSWEYAYNLWYSKISDHFFTTALNDNQAAIIRENYANSDEFDKNSPDKNQKNLMDDKFIGNNIVMLNIYFKDMTVVTIAQSLTYSQIGLISDIAGTIGIIIGFIGTTGLALYQSLKNISVVIKEEIRKLIRPNHVVNVKCRKNADGNLVMVVQEFELDKNGDKGRDPPQGNVTRKSSLP